MSDVSFKKFSDLAVTNSLIAADIIPVVTVTGGNNSKQITYVSLAQTVSASLIGPFTTTITAVEPASAGKWNSTYSTVYANSASWNTGGSTNGFTIFKQISSITSPNTSTTVHALSIISGEVNVDIAILSKGTGATLAQIPGTTSANGNKRGQYATDWQKIRTFATSVASGDYSTIGGGSGNTAGTGAYATVGGGSGNAASGQYSFIGGGLSNSALSSYTTIGGGSGNTASGEDSTVGGGSSNTASGRSSTVGGGLGNTASGVGSTIGCGASNVASGSYSIVGGGYSNTASGRFSLIAGGSGNNTNTLNNTFILGTNITATSADYTYVNNISSQGTVAANNFKYSTTAGTVTAAPIYIDAGAAQLHHVIYTGSATPYDLKISNLYGYIGREVKIHLINRATASRTVVVKYTSDSPALTGTVPLTTTGIVISGSGGAMVANAVATIWVANIDGNIVGSFN